VSPDHPTAERTPSTATAAFAAALALVASRRPLGADAARPPAFSFRAPPWSATGDTGTGAAAGVGGGGAIRAARERQASGELIAADGERQAAGELIAAAGERQAAGNLISAARERQAAGNLTAVELVEQAIAAAEKHGMALGAIVDLRAEEALEEAARLDKLAASGAALGPLHGIPITVKDIIHVAGMSTRAGSAAYHVTPPADAVAVARARAAGAIVLAKVSTHEFALGVTTPQSANPYDPTRIPGGSSGGSAIAVACGIGLASIGTDTRASIRVPAALCGVVGLKGTFGLVPTNGIVPLSWTMDHVAPIASTVADAALMLEVMSGKAVGSLRASLPGSGLRVGVAAATFEGCEPSIAALARQAIAGLGDAVELDRPTGDDLDLANAAGLIVSRCEAAAFHRSLSTDRNVYWDEVSDQLDCADQVTANDYLDAQRVRAALIAHLMAIFTRCDVLCLPTVGIPPPLRNDYTRFLTVLSRACVPWSLAGFPAISVPCGNDSSGFPVGLQIVGPPGADALVIAAAVEVERATTASAERGKLPFPIGP
jgi:aspartyl-tRNA(Asn)/glutamyl-tRNA(Gln) amidotransferase subunit A